MFTNIPESVKDTALPAMVKIAHGQRADATNEKFFNAVVNNTVCIEIEICSCLLTVQSISSLLKFYNGRLFTYKHVRDH